MKKINFKKSEIVIYVLAIMLVTAGYFNYSDRIKKENVKETYSESIQNESTQNTNIGEAVLVSNNEIKENMEENKSEVKNKETEKNEGIEEKEKDNSNDYYINSKLERDKMYAQMIRNYENVINNTNATEVQKNMATQEITKINNQKNAIMICESLILNKGFNNCLIYINDKSINIVVETDGELTEKDVAKIQNIASRELSANIENIHISSKQ